MANEGYVEAAFARASKISFFRRRRSQIVDPEYWRALNPHLSITSHPFTGSLPEREISPSHGKQCVETLQDDGYFQTPPLILASETDQLLKGVKRVVAEGFPSLFTCVYDEFYRLFAGLSQVLSPILGAGYLMVLEGFWCFYIDVGEKHSGTSPHRDSLGPDPRVASGELPGLVNIWIPLTDAFPLNSCIYALPASRDQCYRHPPSDHGIGGEFDLQDIRALPALAGSVLGWSTHLVHWGSRSSQRASHPRASIAVYFQRRDLPPFDMRVLEMDGEAGFEERLSWIADSFSDSQLFEYSRKG